MEGKKIALDLNKNVLENQWNLCVNRWLQGLASEVESVAEQALVTHESCEGRGFFLLRPY